MDDKFNKILNRILNPTVAAILTAIGLGICVLCKKIFHTRYIIYFPQLVLYIVE